MLNPALSFGPIWGQPGSGGAMASTADTWPLHPPPSYSNPPSPHGRKDWSSNPSSPLSKTEWPVQPQQQQPPQQQPPQHLQQPPSHPPPHLAYGAFTSVVPVGSLPPLPMPTRDSTPRSTPPLSSSNDGSPNEDDEEEERLIRQIDELQARLARLRAHRLRPHPVMPKSVVVHSVDTPLELFVGRFLELATEQGGCRFLQQRIAMEGQLGAGLVLNELQSQLQGLMVDAFGNYLYQVLVQHVSPQQRLDMLERVRGNLLRAALNIHGTRSVQKHIEYGGHVPRERDVVVTELGAHISKLAMDTNGNHVVQRMIQSLSHPDFIINAVVADLIVVTRHRHGCSVVQRCIDASNAPQRMALMDKIMGNTVQLSQDPFANYVVQYVFDAGTMEERARLLAQIRGRVLLLSRHKCSSNVVEKALVLAAQSMPAVYHELVGEALPVLSELLNDSFGNFVVQRIIETCRSDAQAIVVVEAVRPHMERINQATARRVAEKVLRRLPEVARDRVFAHAASVGAPSGQFIRGGLPKR